MKIHKKIIVFGLILTFVMGSVKINQIIKGSSEIIYNEHEYKLFSLSKTWNKAKADCEAQGGHLVTISSKEENAFVSNLAGSENIWIGLTDEIHEGSWQWANGESLI
ncbi:MAG: C-type lectin domain-containing protein, partial [Candidatus Hodarchaeales archaeon]